MMHFNFSGKLLIGVTKKLWGHLARKMLSYKWQWHYSRRWT